MTVIIDSTAVINAIRLKEQAGDPAAPAATYWKLYVKSGGLFIEDSASAVTGPFGVGSGAGTLSLTNQCGFGVVAGDHVYVDETNASSFIDNTGDPLGVTLLPGIVEDASIANGAAGLVRFFGIAPVSNLDASASIGDKIAQSTTSLKGTPHTATGFSEGDYGIALDVGTTPPVFLWGSVPVQRNERLLARASGINLNTGTAQTLYTVPAGRTAIVTHIVARLASVSLTTVSFSIGWNSTSFNDVIADATHTELTGNTLYTDLPAKAGAAIGAAAAVLKLKNNISQGSAATATFDVFGYLY